MNYPFPHRSSGIFKNAYPDCRTYLLGFILLFSLGAFADHAYATHASHSSLWPNEAGEVSAGHLNTYTLPFPANGDLLLDQYSDAFEAYSLRRLSSSYSGPAIQVRRTSDGAKKDFGFVGNDLDVEAIETWLAGADGEVVRLYCQIMGHTEFLAPGAGFDGLLIAESGSVLTDEAGLPTMYYERDRQLSGGGQATWQTSNMTWYTVEHTDYVNEGSYTTSLRAGSARWRIQGGIYKVDIAGALDEITEMPFDRHISIMAVSTSKQRVFKNNARLASSSLSAPTSSTSTILIGDSKVGDAYGGSGYISEYVLYPYYASDSDVQDRYDSINSYWQVAPLTYHRQALLPQAYAYQVDLYDWLETISTTDVQLTPGTFVWDGSLNDVDALADLWLLTRGVTTSSVVRGEPEWYVLDAGNGKGIEATGTVRVWHEPKGENVFGSGYSGNPPRSWSNEPAFLYQLDIPRSGGAQGNPYYRNRAMGLRALIVAAVDMMMYHEIMDEGGSGAWTDMFGKALLGWAEAYHWCKDELDAETQAAFEEGFGYFLDRIVHQGARAVNTNMDMFSMQAAAEIYMATDSPALKDAAVRAVKRTLLGYADGELDAQHGVFAVAGHYRGVYAPAGYIMEGDQPEIFYLGESMYHLMGALAAVTDHETGAVQPEWMFLEEIVGSIVDWLAHQTFFDPTITRRLRYASGSGFTGRTSAGAPSGQADEPWKHFALADKYSNWMFKLFDNNTGTIISPSAMVGNVSGTLVKLTEQMTSTYQGTPPVWNGWSPWTKPTPYLPQKGWYSRLQKAAEALTEPPVGRQGVYYDKVFGGYPTGNEYWAYKNTDGEREWGFFVEAQPKQGGYGGWYGGKIETFWTETTGVVLINRHGKGGCDGSQEDSSCHDNIDKKAGHHVWGRDENGKSFTTLLLRGQDLQRTTDWDEAANSVIVHNMFNDPSHTISESETGEETGKELEGSVAIDNTIQALSDGVRVTHAVTSDQTDEVTELWASLPVLLRLYISWKAGDQPEGHLDDSAIEYWNGNAWTALPEDLDSDGVPELVSTTALRIGRDYLKGDGPQYAYVAMTGTQKVRLSTGVYQDPYQTKTRVRTVHIDLHGNPGTVKTLPAKTSVTYSITTTDPTAGPSESSQEESSQQLQLDQGWNMVARSVQLADANVASVFADVQAQIVLVKDEAGRVYLPEFGIDEIGSWDADESLMVYTKEAVTLTLTGTRIDPTATSISLNQGWNLVPYFRNDALAVEEAISMIAAEVVLVKDRNGNVYLPAFGINEIGMMKPGQGYKVYVTQEATLLYPANSTSAKQSAATANALSTRSHTSGPGGVFSAVLVVDAPHMSEPAEVSVWTDAGRVVGSGTIREGRAVVTVTGDDPITEHIVEGAVSGEELSLRMSVDGEVKELTPTSLNDVLSSQYVSNWTYVDDGVWRAQLAETPTQFALQQNYPNPFNPVTTIRYDVSQKTPVKIEVFNTIGQRVALLVDEPKAPGSYEVRFDATKLSSGLYIYRMQSAGRTLSRKMMLMK